MRFMSLIKFDESLPFGPPPPALFEAMGAFAQEGAVNGTLVEQGGLGPSSLGAIVSLANGDVMNWIRFEGDITEIFDISFLPNVRNPMMIGLRTPEIRDLITFETELTTETVAP